MSFDWEVSREQWDVYEPPFPYEILNGCMHYSASEEDIYCAKRAINTLSSIYLRTFDEGEVFWADIISRLRRYAETGH